jgi:uncharacterized protein
MKNVRIIHGCPSNIERAKDPEKRTYDKHWIPWTKKQLQEKGYEVEAPLMPEPWNPNYENFKMEFEKLEVNKESILIGHSCGCAFLVRWLSETENKVDKLILVAPWKIAQKGREKDFYDYKINPKVKENVNKIIMFTSDNEVEEGKKSVKMFHEVLGGKIIDLPDHEHYTLNDMGTEEFPELIKEVIED